MHIIGEGVSVESASLDFIGGKKSAVGGANRGNLAVLDSLKCPKILGWTPYWKFSILSAESDETVNL